MLKAATGRPEQVTDYCFTRIIYDLTKGSELSRRELPVQDDLDFLGGIGRLFKIAAQYEVADPFDAASPLTINTGCFTGTAFMTGLRTFFGAYSPLKRTLGGAPMPAWSAMSGSFGRKLTATGIGDLVLTGAAAEPSILVVAQAESGPQLSLEKAPSELVGTRTPERIGYLNQRYNDPGKRSFPAHFAVIGPAGESWRTVWYACIVGTTQEGLMSGEDKFRYAGRLGMGSVLGSKNIAAIVALAPEDDQRQGDERLKAINREIGRGDQSKGFRHPLNHSGLGGTGKNEKLLDGFGVLPFRNFEPRGENLARPVHLETMRDENPAFVVVDKGCYGCQIACHQDFYAAPEGGRDPDARQARRRHGPFLGRYEFEPMELSGPNLGVLDPHDNLRLSRLDDELGFDTISVNVVLAFLMDYNSRGGAPVAGGLRFGDVEGALRLKEEIAYGREALFGKGVKAISEQIGGAGFAMHAKGVEHSAYLGQTNPGYPFAVAGGHMSMRTFLLYVSDPKCEAESADYWVQQITQQGWACIAKDLHGGCLFALSPPAQVAEGVESIYGVPFSAQRVLDAAYRAHVLGFALERRQGAALSDYAMPDEVFTGQRKGDLPGVHFLSRELYQQIRDRAYEHFSRDAERLGYGELLTKA
ncbi:MAG: aldehyde ferredoxin oxidoreductase C-terminal domain-containing protein [Gemmatimonadota bacterium]